MDGLGVDEWIFMMDMMEGWIESFAFGDFRREREEARSIDEKLILRCPPAEFPTPCLST